MLNPESRAIEQLISKIGVRVKLKKQLSIWQLQQQPSSQVQNASICVSHIFYFLLSISRESIILGSNFRNGDFDGFTRFKGP